MLSTYRLPTLFTSRTFVAPQRIKRINNMSFDSTLLHECARLNTCSTVPENTYIGDDSSLRRRAEVPVGRNPCLLMTSQSKPVVRVSLFERCYSPTPETPHARHPWLVRESHV
jgi:hypothetical protein